MYLDVLVWGYWAYRCINELIPSQQINLIKLSTLRLLSIIFCKYILDQIGINIK